MSNNYTFSGGGIGFNIAYYNSLSVDVYSISCNLIRIAIKVPTIVGCVWDVTYEYSPMCTTNGLLLLIMLSIVVLGLDLMSMNC